MSAGDMEVGRRQYSYEVTREYFTLINDKDHETEAWEDTLCYKLGQLDGMTDVDYDGHFGEFIYFTIDADDDCDELRGQVRRMIETYAK